MSKHKRLEVTNVVTDLNEFKDLEHFVNVREGRITGVQSCQHGLKVQYVLNE